MKPKLEDFYDQSDPRGCSTSEYTNYIKALSEWEKSIITNVDAEFSKPKGVIYGDTLITGIEMTLKDGTKQYQKIEPAIIYKSSKDENKTS